VVQDELDAWFQMLTKYGSGANDLARWNSLNSASVLKVSRVTRAHLYVDRAFACLTGGVQPKILAMATTSRFVFSGSLGRFLLAMPPEPETSVSDEDVDPGLTERYKNMIAALHALPMADPEKGTPYFVDFFPVARERWRLFRREWDALRRASEGVQRALLAKLEAYCARLALVHATVEAVAAGNAQPESVPLASLEAAIGLVEWFANEGVRVYRMLREEPAEHDARKLVEFIAARGGAITASALFRSNVHRWVSAANAQDALQRLVGAGLGQWVTRPPGARGGRPTMDFVLNPQEAGPDEEEPAT
jgi:hypothetical protein